MTTIQIPLDRNPDVAALVADMQPSDKVYGCFTIKDKNAQTLTLRIQEMAATADELSKGDDEESETEADDEGDEGEPDKSPEGKEAETKPASPGGSMGRQLAAKFQEGQADY